MTRQNGKTRTADEMREVISAQQESGKSIKAFCRDNGIGIWIFGYWKKRLRELDNKLPLKSKFTEVVRGRIKTGHLMFLASNRAVLALQVRFFNR